MWTRNELAQWISACPRARKMCPMCVVCELVKKWMSLSAKMSSVIMALISFVFDFPSNKQSIANITVHSHFEKRKSSYIFPSPLSIDVALFLFFPPRVFSIFSSVISVFTVREEQDKAPCYTSHSKWQLIEMITKTHCQWFIVSSLLASTGRFIWRERSCFTLKRADDWFSHSSLHWEERKGNAIDAVVLSFFFFTSNVLSLRSRVPLWRG